MADPAHTLDRLPTAALGTLGRQILIVLARDRPSFNAWCYNSGLSPADPDILYADLPDELRGLSPHVKIIRTHGWTLHRHAARLDEAAHHIELRRRQLWDSAAQATSSSTRSPRPSSRPAPPTS